MGRASFHIYAKERAVPQIDPEWPDTGGDVGTWGPILITGLEEIVAQVNHLTNLVEGPPDPTPTVLGVTSAFNASGASLTLNTPEGALPGDLLVAIVASQAAKSASVDWTAAGFTRVDNLFASAATGDRVHGAYILPLTAAAAASYTFTRVAGGSGRNTGALIAIRGPESATPLDVTAASYDGIAGSTANARAAAALATVGGLELFYAYINYSAGQTHVGNTPPAGFDELANIVTSSDVGTGRSLLWVGARLGVAPATVQAEYMSVGTMTSPIASHFVIKGAARTIASYEVNDMIEDFAVGPVRMSHRLGSAINSEFTEVAGDDSLARGYRILEFSARRASDGTYYGMHDATLDRVTALTGNANSLPWSTLDGTPVDVAAADGGTLMTLVEFLTRYGDDNVLVIEDKTYAVTPMLDVIRDHFGSDAEAAKHVVFKGSVAGSWAPIVKARGYRIWSYCTGAEIDTLAASSYLGSIDFVALNFNATTPQWNTAKALNKPLWAHVILTQADAAAVAAIVAPKRLAGLQVGAIQLVKG